MATRFVQEATKALAPGYTAQQQAIESQVPAIQQLYQTLTTGLEGTRAAETQKILESAAARRLTRSSIPTDLQTALGQSILQQQGQLGAQQAGEIAKVRGQLGELGVQRQQAIQGLANQLYETDLRRQAQQFERQMAERKFQMERQNAEREFQMRMAESRSGGGGGYGGGGGGGSKSAILMGATQAMAQDIARDKDLKYMSAQGGGYLSPERYKFYLSKWLNTGLSATDFNKNFGGYANPTHKWQYGL